MEIIQNLLKQKLLKKYKLKNKDVKKFNYFIISQNLTGLKILGFVVILLEIVFGLLIVFNIAPNDTASGFTILSFSTIALIAVILILLLEKKQKWILKSVIVNTMSISILLLSVIVTYLRFLNNESDLLLYLVVLFALSIVVINKPLKSVVLFFGSYILLMLLISNYTPQHFTSSILFNGLTFIIIATISSTISYTNQLKIFIEKNESKEANKRLRNLSRTDLLTGLNNRRRIDEVLKKETLNSNKRKSPLSIILIDIDYFKKINDEYGHQLGDQILIEFGKVLKEYLRISDTAGRWGGEEFIVICSDTTQEEANALAQRLRRKINEHDFTHDLKIKVSMGICQMEVNGSLDEVIAWADKALYKAKAKGRNRIEVKKYKD